MVNGFFGKPLIHVITVCGQILVSRTNHHRLHHCVYVRNALCVLIPNGPVKHMCAWCPHTRGRFECTHGERSVHTHTVFLTFFQRAATQQHTERERLKQRETEKEGRKDETSTEKTRQEKRRNVKRREETCEDE